MNPTRLFAAVAAPFALAACVAPSAPPPAPPAAVVVPPPVTPVAPPPVLSGDWRDWPVTRGDWRYRRLGTATAAEFGDAVALHMALRCEGGALRLVWPAAAPGSVTVRTSTLETARPATPAPEGGAQIVFPASDPLLDAMAFSRGRFVLQGGPASLVLPAWPEVARVIEDCRA